MPKQTPKHSIVMRFPLAISLLFLPLIFFAQSKDAIKEYNAGLEYYNISNYNAAIPFFKNAVEKDNSFYYAHRSLIACYEQTNQVDQAIDAYQACIKISPSDKGLVYNLSQTYIQQKKYDKAILWLRKALELDPTYAKAAQSLKEVEEYLAKQKKLQHQASEEIQGGNDNSTVNRIYNEALLAYRKKEYAEALAILNSLDTDVNDVTNANFYYLKAIAYQQTGERHDAIEAYEMALEIDDRHFDSNNNLGVIYYNDESFSEAIPLFETAYSQRKNDRDLLYNLARAYYFNEDYKEAAPLLDRYTQLDRDDAQAFFYLAEAYENIGQKRKSKEAFERAKELGGNSEIADELQSSIAEYGNKAREFTKTGNYQKAIEILEEAITKHSEEASLRFNLGLNYLEIGNVKKAQAEFAKTVDLDPSHAKAYQGLGLIYYDKGDFSKAAAYYLATIEAGKADAYVQYKLGNCYYQLNRFNSAIEHYSQAIELKGDEKQFYFSLALAYLKNRNNNKSIAALQQALKIDPMFLDAQYHICINYIESNRFEDAVKEGQKLIKKDPNYAKGYLVIAHAYKRLGNLAEANRYKQRAVELDPSLRD
jgi:tetratricopeptide (TPR) repeat protein